MSFRPDPNKMDKEIMDRMHNEMKKMRERTKKRLQRLLDKEEISFNGQIFVYIESGQKVEDIQYKKNAVDDDEYSSEQDVSNDYDFEDHSKKCEDI